MNFDPSNKEMRAAFDEAVDRVGDIIIELILKGYEDTEEAAQFERHLCVVCGALTTVIRTLAVLCHGGNEEVADKAVEIYMALAKQEAAEVHEEHPITH